MKFSELAGTLLMIRPASFGFNNQTAGSNAFQRSSDIPAAQVAELAIGEFDRMVEQLRSFDIEVIVFDDDISHPKPDAVFPNNWISCHPGGEVILYPMMAPNRRTERRPDVLEKLRQSFEVSKLLDLTRYENEGKFLEGTGSLVFDHAKKFVYSCISPRTDELLVKEVADFLGYSPFIFHGTDSHDVPVYHTNVLLSIGKCCAVVCLDAIKSESEQEIILENLAYPGRRVVAISDAQMQRFAGNVYEVETTHGDSVIIISENALESLVPGQINAISQYSDILPVKIDTIEHYGGGSVRCMVAGVHLPKRN